MQVAGEMTMGVGEREVWRLEDQIGDSCFPTVIITEIKFLNTQIKLQLRRNSCRGKVSPSNINEKNSP